MVRPRFGTVPEATAAATTKDTFWNGELQSRRRGNPFNAPSGRPSAARNGPTLRDAIEPRLWRARWMSFQRPMLTLRLIAKLLGKKKFSDGRLRFHWHCRMLPNKFPWPVVLKRRCLRHYKANLDYVKRVYARARGVQERFIYREYQARRGKKRRWPRVSRGLNKALYVAYLLLNPTVDPLSVHDIAVQRRMILLRRRKQLPASTLAATKSKELRLAARAYARSFALNDPLHHLDDERIGIDTLRPQDRRALKQPVVPVVRRPAKAAGKASLHADASRVVAADSWQRVLQRLLLAAVPFDEPPQPVVVKTKSRPGTVLERLVCDQEYLRATFTQSSNDTVAGVHGMPSDPAFTATELLSRTQALIAAVEAGDHEEAAALAVLVAKCSPAAATMTVAAS